PHPAQRQIIPRELAAAGLDSQVDIAAEDTLTTISRSRLSVGTFSTSLWESAALGRPTYVIEVPGHEVTLQDMESGLFRLARTPHDLVPYVVPETRHRIFRWARIDIQHHSYRHSAALARHAGLGEVRHTDGLLQHGWTDRSPSLVHFSDFARLPRTARRLVWSHSPRGWDPAADPYETTPIGAPFLYLSAMTDDRHVEPLGAAVAFPVHDTRLVKLEQDDAVLARELAERDGPSVVCLHPEDLDRPEKLRVWGAHGHRVVSAGERRDPQFLGRILRLVRGARRVVSNQLSTAVVYAAAEGAPTAIYGSDLSIGALGTEVSQRTRDLWPEF